MSKKKHEVVYNACFGGFSLSKDAMVMLAELGVEGAQTELNFWEEENKKKQFPLTDYSLSRKQLSRHDKRLVQVVKALGDKAGGHYAELRVAKIEGNKYRIEEYDGSESVVEPKDEIWEVIE
jgi:hypothetical protein